MTIALVSAKSSVALDHDLPLLVPVLTAAGIDAEIACWDDETVDWARYERAVVRSTWDYTLRLEAFRRWLDGVAPIVANSAETIRWNLDKRYLRDLGSRGIPVIPTTFLDPGDAVGFAAAELVVKPVVGAGSRDTARYRADQHGEALAHAARLLAEGRGVMVQPYQRQIDEHGETGLLYFGGQFSHAIRKAPILGPKPVVVVGGVHAAEDILPREPAPAELDLADRVVAEISRRFGVPLYARIDLIPDDRGSPVVLEVELVEPSVFLDTDTAAPARFARAIADRTAASPSLKAPV